MGRLKSLFFMIAIMVELCLAAQEQPTNRYGLYLTQTPQGYVLSDSARLIANEAIQPNTRYAHLIRQNDCFQPFVPSMRLSQTLPERYNTCTKEFLLKKLAKRNLNVKVDLPVGVTNPCPFIVFIHGGGWYIGNEEGFQEQSRCFASNGIAGVRVSYTLVPEGGNIHTVLSELQDALRFVFSHAEELGLDISRFGFCGDSAGGYLSSYMAMTTPGTKLYIGICGMYNLLSIEDGYFPGKQGRTDFFQTENEETLKKLSPIYQIPDNPPATLLMHGTADPTINCRQSKEFADAIRNKGGHAELALYEGYGHLFSLKKYSDYYEPVLLKKLAFAQQVFNVTSGNHSNLFRAGDRVSFIGNSITQNGFHLRYLMLYYATRFPAMPLIFNSAGISGDTTEDINRRMNIDVLSQRPDVAIMMSGMNDSFRYYPILPNDSLEDRKREESVEKYEKEYNNALKSLLTDGRRVVLFTPSIYDDKSTVDSYTDKSINTTLSAYADKVLLWGEKYHFPVVNMWKGLMEVNIPLQKKDPKASVIGYDRVHPGYFGGFVMSYLFLKNLKESSIVSDVAIDVKKKSSDVKNGLLSDLQCSETSLSFTLLEHSLPFPLDSEIKDVANYIPFQQEMNLQLLRVDNLREGKYELLIDNKPIGEYSSKELRKGINLSDNIQTPQYRQSLKVSELCEQLRLAFSDYRLLKLVEFQRIGTGLDFNNVDTCIEKVNELIRSDTTANDWIKSTYKWYVNNKPNEYAKLQHISNLREQIYRKAQPITHRYKLVMMRESGINRNYAKAEEFFTDFITKSKQVDQCLGVFTWEPQCYGGWKGYHKGMFDDNGKPISAFNTLKGKIIS